VNAYHSRGQALNPGATQVRGDVATAPKGTVVVGDYHTHGDYSRQIFPEDPEGGEVVRVTNPKDDNLNSDHFSKPDQIISSALSPYHPDYRSYLGTPSGVFKVFNPYTGNESTL
jgi:hypothetical protein